MMRGDRVLKEVYGEVHDESSFKVIYQVADGKYGMYVWAEDKDEAKREVLKRVQEATILSVELDAPDR